MRLLKGRRSAVLRIAAIVLTVIFSPSTVLNVSSAVEYQDSAHPKTNPQETPEASTQVSGHVYRADTGTPIAKAIVALLPVSGNGANVTRERRFTRTDVDGAYTFTHVGVGNYTVYVQNAGFIGQFFDGTENPFDAKLLNIATGEILSKIDLRLVAAGIISGTIFDEDNQPLVGVPVEAVRLRYFPGGRRQELPSRIIPTDDLGNFRLYGLPPGNYFVRIQTADRDFQTGEQSFKLAYYPGVATIEAAQLLKVTAGSESNGIRFSVGSQRLYSITGKVIDTEESGGPRRFILRAGPLDGGDDVQVESLNSDGSFTLRGVPSGDYLLWAAALQSESNGPNRGPQRTRSGVATVRVMDSDARVNIQVSLDAEVSGKVSVESSAGQSVAGITVVLRPEVQTFGTGPNGLIAETDRNGEFRIKYVPSGKFDFSTIGKSDLYLRRVICNGKDYALQPLSIDSGTPIGGCVITMAMDAGVVKGQVADGDRPVPNQVVIAIPQLRSLRHLDRFTVTANTNANGEFQLPGVVPGDYFLFAVPSDDEKAYFEIGFADRNQQYAEHISIKPGETKNVRLRPGAAQ